MELERSDLELIISQLRIAGDEQEEIAGNVSNPKAQEYMDMARYFVDLAERIRVFRDASRASRFAVVERGV